MSEAETFEAPLPRNEAHADLVQQAWTAEEARARCPFLGGLSLENVELLLTYQQLGTQLLQEDAAQSNTSDELAAPNAEEPAKSAGFQWKTPSSRSGREKAQDAEVVDASVEASRPIEEGNAADKRTDLRSSVHLAILENEAAVRAVQSVANERALHDNTEFQLEHHSQMGDGDRGVGRQSAGQRHIEQVMHSDRQAGDHERQEHRGHAAPLPFVAGVESVAVDAYDELRHGVEELKQQVWPSSRESDAGAADEQELEDTQEFANNAVSNQGNIVWKDRMDDDGMNVDLTSLRQSIAQSELSGTLLDLASTTPASLETRAEAMLSFSEVKRRIPQMDLPDVLEVVAERLQADQADPGMAEIREIVRELRAMPYAISPRRSGEKVQLTPEATESVLALMRALGYENPREVMAAFVLKYGTVALLQRIDGLRILDVEGMRHERLRARSVAAKAHGDTSSRIRTFGRILLALIIPVPSDPALA